MTKVLDRGMAHVHPRLPADFGGNVYINSMGLAVPAGEPDITIELDDPGDPEARKAQLNEVAAAIFPLNGIKRCRAVVGGGKMLLQGWGA